jgi:hypothetical protein
MKKIFIALIFALSGGILFNSCQKDINPAEGTLNDFAAIFVVKNAYMGADVNLQPEVLAGASITGGVVISDPEGQNFPKGSLVIQNSSRGLTRGLLIDLGDATIPFVPGDSVVVNVVGGTLSKVGNSLQIKGLPLSNIKKVSSNNALVPRGVSLGQLAAKFDDYENTLVKIIADANPLPASDETYAGNKTLDDGAGNTVILHTQTSAVFAGNKLYASATYTGIAVYGSETSGYGNVKQLRIRTINDVENASGPIYPNWPESFEVPDASQKGSYNMNTPAVPNNTITLKTGSWKLEQAILGNLNANRDRYNAPGLQCIRMASNLSVSAYLQMNFDLPRGASKVTIWHGAYSTDAVSTFKLEYSTNGGTTWTAVAPVGTTNVNVQTVAGKSKQETYSLNINGNIRFRVNKLGLGVTSIPSVLNGRLCIEDIAVYSN